MDDTQQLIAQLTQMKAAADGESSALDKAIGILGGTLASEATGLEAEYRKKLDNLQSQVDTLTATNADLSTQVDILTKEIIDLKTQIDTKPITPPDLLPLQ